MGPRTMTPGIWPKCPVSFKRKKECYAKGLSILATIYSRKGLAVVPGRDKS
jgi:hypothetical protein